MEDIKILEAVERYILGQMSPDERVYFEQLRKSNPEIDQAVVEHTFFLQQMNRFDEVKNLKTSLNETHIHLAEKGLIKSPKLHGKAKVVYLFNRYKKTAMIAASIAGITALTMSALVWSFSSSKNNDSELNLLNRKITGLEQNDRILSKKISEVQNKQDDSLIIDPIKYTSGGSGFLIDAKGYIVTNAHVVEDAKNIAVQNTEGKEFSATTVFIDRKRDIAILKINSKQYKSQGLLPYSIKKTTSDLAEPIFTLGFPRNEIVYGEGYVAATTGLEGDTLALQITIAANQGNSGGPVLNKSGEIIGILTGKQTSADGAVFALHSKYIYQALTDLQKSDTSFKSIKIPSVSSLKEKDRQQQVKKITDYVYMVKVN
jgi:S1-C subfamily serine protease